MAEEEQAVGKGVTTAAATMSGSKVPYDLRILHVRVTTSCKRSHACVKESSSAADIRLLMPLMLHVLSPPQLELLWHLAEAASHRSMRTPLPHVVPPLPLSLLLLPLSVLRDSLRTLSTAALPSELIMSLHGLMLSSALSTGACNKQRPVQTQVVASLHSLTPCQNESVSKTRSSCDRP